MFLNEKNGAAMKYAAVALAAAAVGFAAGWWMGWWMGARPSPSAESVAPGADEFRNPAATVEPDAFNRLVANRAWAELVDRLERLRYSRPDLVEDERLRLLELTMRLGAEGEANAALQLLASYVSFNPRDAGAQFLLADLLERNGQLRKAMEPLFAILEFPPDGETALRARQHLERLIHEVVQLRAGAGDATGPVALYRDLVLREPGHDGHRLGLIRWLARAAKYSEAAAELKQLGRVGITDAQVEAVERELALGKSELPVTREGLMLFAELRVAGAPVRMLIDTGATQTGMRGDVLRRLGASDLGRTVRVRTAGGVVAARLHRVRELVLGELRVEQLDVLALDSLPAGVDGLLGMDVLGRYPRLGL